MSNALTALERYTKAVEARDAHIEKHKGVFDEHEKIVFAIVDAENELRDAVAESKEGVVNDKFRVVVTPQTQTFVDPEALKARQGQTLTPAVIGELVVTNERPPRISIQAVK